MNRSSRPSSALEDILPDSTRGTVVAWFRCVLLCRKVAVVPVEANVAAILRATWPDLPSPLTIELASHSRIEPTACSNS